MHDDDNISNTACGTPIILMITIIKAEANVQLFVCFLLLFH